MNSLAIAVGDRIKDVHKADAVYADVAEDDAKMPYHVFWTGITGPSQYHSGSRIHGTMNDTPVTVISYSPTRAEADADMEAIIEAFETSEWILTSGGVVRMDVISKEVSRDPDNDEEGRPIYRGTTIFNALTRTE